MVIPHGYQYHDLCNDPLSRSFRKFITQLTERLHTRLFLGFYDPVSELWPVGFLYSHCDLILAAKQKSRARPQRGLARGWLKKAGAAPDCTTTMTLPRM